MQAEKVLPKGQITLPKEIRKDLNIKEGDTLIIEKTDGDIILKKVKPFMTTLVSFQNQKFP
jgi:AbrB family looped-hinge helix DNA binding protein